MLDRRQFSGVVSVALGLLALRANALDLGSVDAAAGLRAALERGAGSAVDLLGRTDGFLGNEKVRIPLPRWVDKSQKLLKLAGYGDKVQELNVAMNRAAEAAVPEARALLVGAVKKLTVTDARRILGGGDTAVTDFFAEKTRTPLGQRFLPIVTKATEQVGAARALQRAGRPSRRARSGERRGCQPAAPRHRQGAGRVVRHDWRGRTPHPPGPGGHRQRDSEEGVRQPVTRSKIA